MLYLTRLLHIRQTAIELHLNLLCMCLFPELRCCCTLIIIMMKTHVFLFLTGPTLKLKRSFVDQKYKDIMDSFYHDWSMWDHLKKSVISFQVTNLVDILHVFYYILEAKAVPLWSYTRDGEPISACAKFKKKYLKISLLTYSKGNTS